ncbi:unnamed protein product, partial [Hapterophycus canaliculatus]
QVNRNNFRPPPKVDSRVVRIELRNPPPPVNFTEWDGMIRVIFNRKHKTLRSTLTTKASLKVCSSILSRFLCIQPDCSAEVKEMIEEVLKQESLEGRRAASMDIDDLLALLSAFNEKGVHFA